MPALLFALPVQTEFLVVRRTRNTMAGLPAVARVLLPLIALAVACAAKGEDDANHKLYDGFATLSDEQANKGKESAPRGQERGALARRHAEGMPRAC